MEGNPIELRCNDEEGSTNVISRYRWLHNGKYLTHSLKVLQINVTSRMDNGNFTCTAENEAGEARYTIEINVLYAPVIENYSVYFFENNSNILVNCNASGNPNNFTFGEWNHISDADIVIRHLNGSNGGILAISSFTGRANAYENGGVYACNVSNGIPSTDGSLWKTGTIHVIIKESPVFTAQSKSEQIGYIDKTSNLFVDVMSSSKIISLKWYKERSEVFTTERFTMTQKALVIEAQFHNKMVYTKCYRFNLTIDKTKPKDFHNYTVTVQNNYGSSSFIIQLQYAGPPRMPQITTLERTPYAILVKWEQGFNGGHRTTFEIEYRKVTDIKWDRNHIKEFITDHMGGQQFTAIVVMMSILYIMAAVFGLKYAVKNRRCFSKYKDRVTPFQRREEVSVTPGHYYDIDSMYLNPINNTISSQNHRNIAELGIQQLSNMTDNFDDTNSSSYQSIGPCTVRQVESDQENYSARSSMDESYLISRRMSDLSETYLKSIQRYETLNFPAKK